jgi:(p)ppGpp synthase/HD superfamily hydrolase
MVEPTTVPGPPSGTEPISSAAAALLATRLLGELRTRLGGLRIAHARRVAARVRTAGDDRCVAAALLHDVVEKGRISLDDLFAITGDVRLVELVGLLTREPEESDFEYLARCASDPDALLIKRADLADRLMADDWNVTPATAARIRRQAARRLNLLNGLARSQLR